MLGSEKLLVAYNTWANRATIAAYRRVAAARLHRRGSGLTRDLHGLVLHLVAVEADYVRVILGMPDDELKEATPAALARHGRWTSASLEKIVAGATDASLERVVRVPWFTFEPTVREVLLHTLVHSTQHRADIATTLTQLGVRPPNIGFSRFVRLARAH